MHHEQNPPSPPPAPPALAADPTPDAAIRQRRGYRPYVAPDYRGRSHESAHTPQDGEATTDTIPPIRHPLVSHDPPLLVQAPDELAALLEHLSASGAFAYDSEFIGERSYLPKLCLIQVATTQRVALIDALSPELDLSPFWQMLSDPALQKVVHAGQQDIEPVYRHTRQPAANVFDTQIAAGFCGLAYPVALAKLVRQTVGAKLGKGLTFTHWDQRPLSAMQLRYAADDVRYLLAVREALGERLAALGHIQWAQAACDALCEPTQYGFDPSTAYQRVRGSGSLPPRGLAVLRALTVWRNNLAKIHDVPSRVFLRDEVMVDLARSPARSLDRLQRVKGLPRPLIDAHGEELLQAIAAGLATPADQCPAAPRDVEPSPRQRFVADSLWCALQCLASGRGIDPALLTSRQEVGELHRLLEEHRPIEQIPLLQGWRREAVGQRLLDLLGGSRVELHWTESLKAEMIQTSELA